jgi:alkanesulfonate monooxygenase SsuD/methylene tetrahydromethanopterin reductase-like flavin-dependent oxidoreductase (luciferase family)
MMNESRLKLGLAVPIFANPGAVDFRTPSAIELDWPAVKRFVKLAELSGYDSVWVADHMFLGRDGAILESWTTLSAIAGMTEHVRLVNIHLGNGFRHAPLVAKMAATLDVISNGRFELFIDPAWRQREHEAYGFEWESDRSVRTRRVSEAIDVIRQLWSSVATSYDGEFYHLKDAICAPGPVKFGGPPIWIGEAFDEQTLRLVAQKADGWNSMPAGLEVLEEKISKIRDACLSFNRDPSTLRMSLETQVLIIEDEADWRGWLKKWANLRAEYPPGPSESDFFEFVETTNSQLGHSESIETLTNEFLIGTRQQVADKLLAYKRLGIEEVVCWFMDYPDTKSMEVLANEVRQMVGN